MRNLLVGAAVLWAFGLLYILSRPNETGRFQTVMVERDYLVTDTKTGAVYIGSQYSKGRGDSLTLFSPPLRPR